MVNTKRQTVNEILTLGEGRIELATALYRFGHYYGYTYTIGKSKPDIISIEGHGHALDIDLDRGTWDFSVVEGHVHGEPHTHVGYGPDTSLRDALRHLLSASADDTAFLLSRLSALTDAVDEATQQG